MKTQKAEKQAVKQNKEKESEEEKESGVKIKKFEVKFRNENQEKMYSLMQNKEITICAGPAGCGKTHLAIAFALEQLREFPEKYKKIMITTPVVEADEHLGYLPGDVSEKLAPFIYSFVYLFEGILGKEKTKRMMERQQIHIMPFAHMRGINVSNTILIADEVQNCTQKQMKTLLTRIELNSKMICLGDTEQSDRYEAKDIDKSGLQYALNRLDGMVKVGTFRFTDKDIVRNPIIAEILERLR